MKKKAKASYSFLHACDDFETLKLSMLKWVILRLTEAIAKSCLAGCMTSFLQKEGAAQGIILLGC